jgi:hypothetical protein
MTPFFSSRNYERRPLAVSFSWQEDYNHDEPKKKRHSPDHIVRKIQEPDRISACGSNVTEATYDRWRSQFGGLKAWDAKKLKRLENKNCN